MSSEMIERVAKAIHSHDFPTYALKWEDTKQQIYLDVARIAIEAMKEPTQAMLDAAEKSGSLEEGSSAYGCWQAMIEAALKDD